MSEQKKIGVGIIGAGRRGITCIGVQIAETTQDTGFEIRALCDRNPVRMQEAADQLTRLFKEKGVSAPMEMYLDYQDLIDDPSVDLIVVTTPSYVHRDPTIAALRSGKKVYLDKPMAHNLEDSIAIVEVEIQTKNPLIMGFTRRYETSWRKAFSLLEEGAIGDLHMIQIRSVIPYDVYAHTWHRRRAWSGGALNDKSSHHFDVFNWFAKSRPKHISAIGGQRVYTPDPTAPPTCSVCERSCPYRTTSAPPESIASQDNLTAQGDSWIMETEEIHRFDNCVYRPDADINDHAVMQVAYENGIVASLFWCMFGPKAEDQETLELVGSKGRIMLTRQTAELDLVTDYGKHHEVMVCKDESFGTSHFGADTKLIRDMRAFFDGEESVVSSRDGFESMRMVTAAHRSIDCGGERVFLKDVSSVNV